MKAKKSNLYLLLDPRNQAIRFVGCSSKPTHTLGKLDPRFPVTEGGLSGWIAELQNIKKSPMVTIVKEADSDWQAELADYYTQLTKEGHKLFPNKWADITYKGPTSLPPKEVAATVGHMKSALEMYVKEMAELRAELAELKAAKQ
jgi:hypothetical protein